MAIDILYFAWVREAIGTGSERVDPPAGVLTVADLVAWLAARSPGHAEALADRTKLRVALDNDVATLASPLGRAREVALFPPVTGG